MPAAVVKVGPKTCPFCGGESRVLYACGEHWVVCTVCNSSGPMTASEGSAVELWDRRFVPT